MFMDLKSSTEIAEKLGHLQYSSFVRDSIMDINQELSSFNAKVYQYVGDEVVNLESARRVKRFLLYPVFLCMRKAFSLQVDSL